MVEFDETTNAKKEILKHIKGREVEYISIVYRKIIDIFSKEEDPLIVVKGTLLEVLPLLDFEYYAGYGRQVLNGYIWYTDGTWSSRSEYDGSEWWDHHTIPDKNEKVSTSF